MDEKLFEAWCEGHEFAFTSTPTKIKAVWKQLTEEFDIEDEIVAQVVEKLFSLGVKEGS